MKATTAIAAHLAVLIVPNATYLPLIVRLHL